jgi:hypothetical protein
LALLPVVIVAGLVVGTALSDDGDEPDEESVTLDEGEIGGVEWRVDAQRDIEGDTCVFLFQDGDQLNGACTLDPQDVTIGDQTVVFGRAASDRTTVEVELDGGEVVELDTTTAEGMEGRFYVDVVAGDVDVVGFAR